MKFLFLFLVSLSTTLLFSQQYLNHTSTWREYYSGGGAGNPYFTTDIYTITLTGDTLINSKIYYKVLKSGTRTVRNWVIDSILSVTAIHESMPPLREESGVFYVYRASHDDEIILHNFNLSVGDTAVYTCSRPQIVVRIDTVYIGNIPRKQFHFVNGSGWGVSTLIEGVGHTHGLYTHPCNPKIIIEGGGLLQCYSMDEQYIQLDDNVECGTPTAVEPGMNHTAGISLFPNPCKDFINLSMVNIPSQKTNIQLFDLNGKLLLAEEFPLTDGINRINLEGISSGIYIMQIYYGKMRESRKIVIL